MTHMLNLNDTQIAFAYKSNHELVRDYQLFRLINQNWLVKWGTQTASKLIDMGLKTPVAWGMRPTIYATFCGGESLEDAQKKINRLYEYKVHSILDYGVEGKETEADFERTFNAILKSIHYASNNSAVKIVCAKFTGLVPFSILEKLDAGQALSADEEAVFVKFKSRVHQLAQAAYEKNISLFVDAEETWIQQPLDDITFELMLEFNQKQPVIYNTTQHYRKDRLAFLQKEIEKAKEHNIIYAVKLVRGAYMEKENLRAAKLNYACPIQDSKAATDHDYDEAVKLCLQNIKHCAVCIATHNENSTILATRLMEEMQLGLHHPHIHFSQLYGMSDNITFNMANAGYNAHKYLPYGPVKDVIPYLIRRAQENTSVSGQMGRELKLLREEVKRRKLITF